MKDLMPFSELMGEDIITHYDDIIKLGYSRNYALLKYLLKAKIADESLRDYENEFGRASLPKFIVKQISDSYHKQANTGRINFFSYVVDLLNENLYAVQSAYKIEEYKFLKQFNDYYGTDKTAEESFKGLTILDETLLKDLSRYEKEQMTDGEMDKFLNLWNEYLVYQSETRLAFNFVSLCDIFNSLISDFSEDGYKSISYGIPSGDVALISREEIAKLRELVKENYVAQNNEMWKQEQVVKSATKKARKNPNDKELEDELQKQINILTDIYNKSSDIVNFEKLVNIFEERIDFANFEYDVEAKSKYSNRLRWKLENSGSKKHKKPVNSIYYHRAEATILEFDSRALYVKDPLIDELLARAGGEFALAPLEIPEEMLMTEEEEEENLQKQN